MSGLRFTPSDLKTCISPAFEEIYTMNLVPTRDVREFWISESQNLTVKGIYKHAFGLFGLRFTPTDLKTRKPSAFEEIYTMNLVPTRVVRE